MSVKRTCNNNVHRAQAFIQVWRLMWTLMKNVMQEAAAAMKARVAHVCYRNAIELVVSDMEQVKACCLPKPAWGSCPDACVSSAVAWPGGLVLLC